MTGFDSHGMAVIGGRIGRRRLATSRPGGQIMKRLTNGELFAPPKKARKTKARLDRAKLVIVKARERAVAPFHVRGLPNCGPMKVIVRHRCQPAAEQGGQTAGLGSHHRENS
jgi:hypothetical protein